MCVALDAGGRYAATGSLSSRPVLRIWDIGTSSTSKPVKITEIGLLPAPPSTEGVDIYGRGNERQETTIPFYERCIACVAFSSDPGANYVVGVGHDLRHMVAIWHWRSGKLIAEVLTLAAAACI
jgi:WD40 repeat protein